ncbi:hypothetical protein L1049_021601 [Liquidambar formosana]|uniref:Uncharacterized protein n=1 Tax=Liquidambar formosana TaxID=63359 RepID=A0AAP0N766_LIQFO
MAKVYPQTATCSTYITSRRETFTIWMKSLVVHGNGCTVFDSNGEIVYRIDNYDKKCSNEVYLMDRQGKVLFTIQRKKLRVFGRWDGYKRSASKVNKEKPWFQVRKNFNVFEENLTCQVTVGYTKAKACCYRMEGLAGKLAFKIIDSDGDLIAEIKQKQSSSGIMLGNDVLTLSVEPHIDHSLIVALVAIHGLINHKM